MIEDFELHYSQSASRQREDDMARAYFWRAYLVLLAVAIVAAWWML